MSSKSRSRYHGKSIQRAKNDAQGAHLVPEGSQMTPQSSPRATQKRQKIKKFGPKVDKMSTWASDLAPGIPRTPKECQKDIKNEPYEQPKLQKSDARCLFSFMADQFEMI